MMAMIREEPRFIYEDRHLVGIYKPADMPTQRDSSGDFSLLEWAKAMLRLKEDRASDPYLGLIHRLDRPVPGILVMARTSKAAARLSLAFRERKVQKIYLAVVKGALRKAEGRLVGQITRGPNSGPDAIPREGMLIYKALETIKGLSLLRVELLTGRHHQIRIQLKDMGFPIVNDKRYGGPSIPHACIGLLGRELLLEHPMRRGETLRLISPLPRAFPWPGPLPT